MTLQNGVELENSDVVSSGGLQHDGINDRLFIITTPPPLFSEEVSRNYLDKLRSVRVRSPASVNSVHDLSARRPHGGQMLGCVESPAPQPRPLHHASWPRAPCRNQSQTERQSKLELRAKLGAYLPEWCLIAWKTRNWLVYTPALWKLICPKNEWQFVVYWWKLSCCVLFLLLSAFDQSLIEWMCHIYHILNCRYI